LIFSIFIRNMKQILELDSCKIHIYAKDSFTRNSFKNDL
jgi:hypothetical protein